MTTTQDLEAAYRASIGSIRGTVHLTASLGIVTLRVDGKSAQLAPGAASLLAAELMRAAVTAERQGSAR